MTRPAGVIDLSKVKARLAAFRKAPAKGPDLSEQDVRMAVASFNHRAMAEGPSLTQAEVNYRDGTPAQQCGNCVMFEAPEACTLVEGTIRAEGVCDRWEPASAT